jgi:hypothetical protein
MITHTVVKAYDVYVYAEPPTWKDSPGIGYLPGGSEVIVTETARVDGAIWARTEYGWVSKEFLYPRKSWRPKLMEDAGQDWITMATKECVNP